MGRDNKPSMPTKALVGEVLSASDTLKTPPRPAHPIATVLDRFLWAEDDYRDAVSMAFIAVAKKRLDELKRANARISKFISESKDDGTSILMANGPHAARDMFDSLREQERLTHSRILPLMSRSFFIGLFSEYDSFIGALLKAIYSRKPELYKGIKREIALTELLSFQDLDEVKKDMLEKEIDSFRRESYIEQFSELERKFEIKTLRAFPEWTKFVEYSQRRNVMTHNDGRVSQQYLSVCEREGVKFSEKPKIGDELQLTNDYMREAIFVISKVGFMLAHTLWRKVLPDDLEDANDAMNNTLYGLLIRKRWAIGASFGEFGLSDQMTKGAQEISLRIRIINTAIGLSNAKRKPEAEKLLNSQDWSACIRDFKLATAILKESYLEAAKIMRDIGKHGELVNQLAYHDWPLFEDFRGQPEFQSAYQEIYGIPFIEKISEEALELSKERDPTGSSRSTASGRKKLARLPSAKSKKQILQ
jgi:hypothetical protein